MKRANNSTKTSSKQMKTDLKVDDEKRISETTAKI